jgi:hypothetical protein
MFMTRYIILLVAFAFSFYILFKENVKLDDAVFFEKPFSSLLKTIIMFAGKFESPKLPFDTLPYTSHVIFLMFIFFVALVLLNLLNGLAVGDTGDIRKIETLSLVARARLISNTVNPLSPELNPICYLLALLAHDFLHVSRIRVKVFSTLPQFMTCYLKRPEEMFVLYPNRPNQLGPTELRSLLRIITKKRELIKMGNR